MRPALSILEGKWATNSDVSVRELFVPLFTVWTKNPGETYHYEQFTNGAAFRDGLKYCFQRNRAETIYIGAHGNKQKIYGFHDQGISRSVIRNAMQDSGVGKRGIFFGACSFVTETNARFILNSCPRVQWIAGYETNVDWSDSGVLDLHFFRHFLFPSPGRGNTTPKSALARVGFAAQRVVQDMAPLVSRLGMKVYVRSAGRRSGKVTELIDGLLEAGMDAELS